MDSYPDETKHAISLLEFENKKYKDQILQEVTAAICAMLNSNGGKVVIYFEIDGKDIPVDRPLFSKISLVIRILEQYMISIIGENQTVSKINFSYDKDIIVISIKKADSLITANYKLYLPSQTQVVEVSPLEPLENIMNDILSRKAIPNPVKLGSHCKIFFKDKENGFHESKSCQFKNLKAEQSKRTTLADRMTGKGNKFSCYVSAFANHCGGHIYYGITSERVVVGEFIQNEKDRDGVIKKVEKVINKMIWPEQISQPKRGEQWELFFEPVLDENSESVASTFVIVIYIASCLGGVFTDVPECYEMVGGKVRKMSFAAWKKGILQPVWLRGKEEVPVTVERVTWSSAAAQKTFSAASEKLRELINDGQWDAISKLNDSLQEGSHKNEKKLVVLSKQVTACYRRGRFENAQVFLDQYMTILPEVKDLLIFEVVGLHIKAALKRATGDLNGLKEALTAALSKAEMIKPGLVTATVYVFAATVSDLVPLEKPTNKISPDVLSIKALEHSQYVKDCPSFHADKAQKVHITLGTFYLGCNLSGQLIKQKSDIDSSDIKKAASSILAVHQLTYNGKPLSKYRKVQFKLAQSIYCYRHSQVRPVESVNLLRSAFNYAKKAERLSRKYKFTEMLEWSKENTALCAEEIVRAKLISLDLQFTICGDSNASI